jgi:kynurenine formamidase
MTWAWCAGSDMPLWPGHPKFIVLNYKFHGETKELEPATYENDMVVMCSHAGTHMDALNHIGERRADGKIAIYGDYDVMVSLQRLYLYRC